MGGLVQKRDKKRSLEKRIEKMGKTPKQYKRRSGATTPERIDVDDELERQLARNTRDQSTEREKTRLDQRREERRTERTKDTHLLLPSYYRARARTRKQTQQEPSPPSTIKIPITQSRATPPSSQWR